ncbi:MAG: double zinc ribbon domain-containing protein [Ruminococcus sp.]|nr:double zinc ribbon domain-containing protein [Ruminococcus sp.]
MKKNSKVLNHKFWLDLIMPNRCPVCGKVIVWNELVCNKCESNLPFLDKPFSVSEKIHNNSMNNACAVFEYKENAVKGIYNLKTRKGLNFAEYASKYLVKYLSENDIVSTIDCVAFVPMTKSKRRLRGYNQAERFAKFMARKLDKPLMNDLLLHISDSSEQHTLDYNQRQQNAETVFKSALNHSDIKGKSVLLCDDVITTGATMNKCAELLKSMGANSVYGTAICSTNLRKMSPKE